MTDTGASREATREKCTECHGDRTRPRLLEDPDNMRPAELCESEFHKRGEVAIPDTPAATDIYRDYRGTIRCGKCNLRPHNCICDRNPAPSIPDRGEPSDVLKSAYNMIAFLRSVIKCGELLSGKDDEDVNTVLRQINSTLRAVPSPAETPGKG